MWKDFGDVVGIIKFTAKTSPFFNMKKEGVDEKTGEELYNKCDLIICGQETFGSAERSIDIEQMRESFYTISDGKYSQLLFDQFGKEDVIDELNQYLELPMISRWGFGSGTERLLRAMKIKSLL
jgi:aspartyl/asparaginyl-tRNA synthetase